MIFTKLKMNYFGRFQNRIIELKPGINLIYGDNEAGKSTLHTFIRGMLFGIERLRGRGAASKEDTYTRYLPWDYPGAYSGSMDIKIDDKEYRLQRSFHANDKNFTVADLTTGREVKLKEGLISELFPGLTETTFKNTISMEQLKAQTDAELAAQVRNYITNLSIAKSNEVNVAKAISLLVEQRKQLEISQNTSVFKTLQAEIEEGLQREERIDQLSILLRELLAEEKTIQEQKETILKSVVDNETVKQMEQLPAMLEKYRSYQELVRQENSLQLQTKDLRTKIITYEKELHTTEALKEDMVEMHRLQAELFELNMIELELQGDKERLNRDTKKNIFVSLIPCGILALFAAAVTKLQSNGILIVTILMILGVIGYIMLSLKNSNKQKNAKTKNSEIKQNRLSVQAQMNNLLHKYGVIRIEDLAGRQEEVVKSSYALELARAQLEQLEQRQKELEDNRDYVYDAIMNYMQHFIVEEDLTNSSMQKLRDSIANRKLQTSGRLVAINQQQEGLRLKIEKLRWEIGTLEGNEEELLKNREKYLLMEQKQKENAIELEAVKLALVSIQELSVDIHDSFGQQLNNAVSKVISEVTGKKYTDLKVDEKLQIKVGWNGDYVLLERLSAGTIDQVYYALRMAVADLLLGKDTVPLLLDDSFALYDEIRVRSALSQLSQRNQVILFTCHKREQRLLEELGLPYHLVDLSCG